MAVARMLWRGRQTRGGGGGGVPEGVIALWSGTLANIPANWNLCDGGGVTPNLVARFLRGAPAATEPGTTGGSDSHGHASMTAAGSHTHTAQSVGAHTHLTNFGGLHIHRHAADTGDGPGNPSAISNKGSHQHTTNSAGGHTHTMDTYANHTHVINTADGRPPFYEVAFIQAGVGALVAVGIIIIWTGTLANIPAGWALCDGGDSRPDLRTNFVRGVNTAVTDPGGLGGGATHIHVEDADLHSHTMNNSGTHFHTYNAYNWLHDHNTAGNSTGANASVLQTDSGSGVHTHANTDNIGSHNHNPLGNNSHAHTVNSASSLPIYYEVAYIINVAAALIPSEGILVWTGLLANIPVGYSLCDGGDTRPELRGKFLRGSADGVDPGGEGGSDSHTHTDQNGGAHAAHSQTSAGDHDHAETDVIGSHTHTSGLTPNSGAAEPIPDLTLVRGAHSHGPSAEGGHLNHAFTDPGDHAHNPWSTDDGRPDYYEVAFIMKA